MMKSLILPGLVAAALVGTPATSNAQSADPGRLTITPYGGYMRFGSLVDGPLGTSIGSAGGPVIGGQVKLGLTPNISLIGHVAHASSNLRVQAPIIGGLDFGSGSAWLYDAGVQVSLPLESGIVPFAQAGAGAMRQSYAVGPVSTHATNFAWNVGAGADIPVSERLGLQVMVKDYVGKFDAREVTGISIDTRTTHNVAVTAGLRLAF
jgi:opacity protein-like surface antigen